MRVWQATVIAAFADRPVNVGVNGASPAVLPEKQIPTCHRADWPPLLPLANDVGHGANVDCSRVGLTVLAGERETYYRCSWHRPATKTENSPGRYEQACAAYVEGRVYGVSC